jgi:O-antigen ligase
MITTMASMHVSTTAQDRTVTILAWMVFLIPAVGVPSELVLQDTLKSAIAAVGVLLAAFAFFWQQRGQVAALRWHVMVLLPIALLLYALVSMAWSHPYLAGVEACRWFTLSLLVWLGLNTFTRTNLPRLAWGIHAGVAVASLWVVLQFWVDLQLFPQAAPPASTFINRNFFAEYAACALPFSVMVLAQARRSRWLPALALSLVCVVLAILMTGTRSALLALLVLLPVLGVALVRYRSQLAFWQWSHQYHWIVGTVLVLGVVGLGMMPTGSPLVVQEGNGVTALQRSFIRTASMAKPEEYTVGSFSIRALMWRSTARMLIDKPWTGVGAGAWEVQIPLYQGAKNSVETDFYAHNEYLQLLGEYGLPVGGLFLAVLFAYGLKCVSVTWKLHPEFVEEAPWRATALASLLALLIVSNAGFPWHLAGAGTLFMVCLAILASSDTRMGTQSGTHGVSLWQPRAMQLGALVFAACSVLAGYLTQQAMLAEYKIVHAIHLTNAVLRNPVPNAVDAAGVAPLDERKADIVRSLREGVAINPHYRKLTTLAADQMARMGDNAGAAWALQSIAESRPHIPDLWANLALLHSQLGDAVQAQKAMAQLQRLQPDTPRARAMEIVVLQRASRAPQAQALLNAYLAEGRVEYDLLLLGYSIGMETKDWPLVIRSLELRIAQWPLDAAEGYFKLGLLYASPELHEDSRALQAFRQGLAAVPATQKEAYMQAVPAALRSQL